jgi:transcriptional regulator with XRE-family HTH domain
VKQVDVMGKTGISNQTLSMIERGDQLPTIPQVAALSDFFGVTIDNIVKG